MKLESLSKEVLRTIANLMASESQSDAKTKQLISELVGKESLATRVTEWLPEAFGYVLISRMPGVTMPTTFHARDAGGVWHELPFSVEPLVSVALELGVEAIGSGKGEVVGKISLRSSIVAAVNSALNAGVSVAGSKISGPAFVKIPAET